MKYIIVIDNGLEKAIIFDELLTHLTVARGFNVISAGFCSIGASNDKEMKVQVYGESVTLDMRSRKEDATLIEEALGKEI